MDQVAGGKCEGVVLVTGGARRVGAAIVRALHAAGMNVAVHCRGSVEAAKALADELNVLRARSAAVLVADLADADALQVLATEAKGLWGPSRRAGQQCVQLPAHAGGQHQRRGFRRSHRLELQGAAGC